MLQCGFATRNFRPPRHPTALGASDSIPSNRAAYKKAAAKDPQAAKANVKNRNAPLALKPPKPPSSARLYNGMIAPLQPYAIRGALWYQGEANAGDAPLYRFLLPAMIADWRQAWGQGDFPFLIVQLTGWAGNPHNPRGR